MKISVLFKFELGKGGTNAMRLSVLIAFVNPDITAINTSRVSLLMVP